MNVTRETRLAVLMLAWLTALVAGGAPREVQVLYSIGTHRVKTPASIGTAIKLQVRDTPELRHAWAQIEADAREAFRRPIQLAPLGVPVEQAVENNKLNEAAVRTMVDMTYAWCVTGNPHYRNRTLDYFTALMSNFPAQIMADAVTKFHQRHTLYARDWLPKLALCYDVLYDGMPQDQRRMIAGWLRQCAGQVADQKTFNRVQGTSHAAWYAAAAGMVGIAIGDEALVRQAEQRLRLLCEHWLGPDGMLANGSVVQHFSALRALIQYSEASMLRSENPYQWHDARGQLYIRKMLDAPLALVDPFGMIAGNNRAQTRRPPGDLYLIAALRYDDAGYGAFARQDARALTPEVLLRYGAPCSRARAEARPPYSIISPTLGWALLRSVARTPAQELFARLDYGVHGGRAGHADKLALYFSGFGRHIMTDEDGYAVVVNYRSQAGAETVDDTRGVAGTLVLFDRTPALSVVEAEARAAYPSLSLASYRRCIAVADIYVLDIFTVIATRAITADWVFNGLGKNVAVVHATPGERSLNNEMVETSILGSDKDGYRWIDDVQSYTANEQWGVTWSSGLHTIMMGQPGTQVLVGKSGGDAKLAGEHVDDRTYSQHTLIARRANVLDTRFVAVHEILYTNKLPVLSFARLETGTDALVLEVMGKRFRDVFVLQTRNVSQKVMVDEKHELTLDPRRYAYARFALPANTVVEHVNCSVTTLE
ncbi:MAG: alginate lyase family protein [bacterium]|nr:alginate lyase family protein [bacterium]